MKTQRNKKIRSLEPIFINKIELAHHLQCHVNSIDGWVANGTIPPPHSCPGVKHALWLRRHFTAFVESGVWPGEAWTTPAEFPA